VLQHYPWPIPHTVFACFESNFSFSASLLFVAFAEAFLVIASQTTFTQFVTHPLFAVRAPMILLAIGFLLFWLSLSRCRCHPLGAFKSFLGLILCTITKSKKQKNNIRDSNVVPHRSTNRARQCVTSQSERDAVLSLLYGRS
jgi:hypothetical protein